MPRRDARMGGLKTMKSTPARLRASADAHTLTSSWQSVLDPSAFCNRGECSQDGRLQLSRYGHYVTAAVKLASEAGARAS